jgi:hypothetical protein
MNRVILILTMLLTAGTFHFMNARPDKSLEGFWENRNTGITIEIIETGNGIKVKRLDKHDWRRYEQNRYGVFIDREGNYYEEIGHDELIWQSHEGRKKIRFTRAGFDSHWYEDKPNTYIDRSRNSCSEHCAVGCQMHGDSYGYNNYVAHSAFLNGVWINRPTKSRLTIRMHKNGLKIRKGHFISYFNEVRPGKFVDHRGNKIKILGKNRLQFKEKYTHRTLIFKRGPGSYYDNNYKRRRG